MESNETIRIVGIEMKRRSALLLFAIFIVHLYPFVLDSVSSGSAYYGLPDWYWISAMVLILLTILFILFVNSTADDLSRGG